MSVSLTEPEGLTPSPAPNYDPDKYDRFKELVIAYLGGKCVVCGTTHNLEFDHIDPSTKNFNITDKYTCSLEFLKPELDKCQLLCHEHHVEKHEINWEHGTYRGYNRKKCRCALCKAANADYSKAYRGIAQLGQSSGFGYRKS